MTTIADTEIDFGADVLDSRDITARIEFLSDEAELTPEETTELDALKELDALGIEFAEDWKYGETLVADWHFEDYARELAENIGAIDPNADWPLSYIDWAAAADALKRDYTEIEIEYEGGEYTYWVR